MNSVSASSPWMSFARKLYMLFGQDPDIRLVYETDGPEIKMYVNDIIKADAINKKIPNNVEFGNVSLKITIIPSNTEKSNGDTFEKIFIGNPIFKGVVVDDDPISFGLTHVIFENKVVQFFDDQLNDPNGLESTLYEDIAREVFENGDGVFFNTEASDDATMWP